MSKQQVTKAIIKSVHWTGFASDNCGLYMYIHINSFKKVYVHLRIDD